MNKQDKSIEALSKRWTYAEHTGVLCGRMGVGSPTWARGTTRAVRPEVNGPVIHRANHVSSLEACDSFRKAKQALIGADTHNAKSVCKPFDDGTVSEVRKAIRYCDKEIYSAASRIAAVDAVRKALKSLAKGGGTVKTYA